MSLWVKLQGRNVEPGAAGLLKRDHLADSQRIFGGDYMFGENMAVNVVDAKSVISDTIGWAHEVRHNFGLQHDYEHANPKDGPPVLDYAYGYSYCDEFVHFGDIMSYSCDDYYKSQPLYSSPDSYRMDTSGNPDLRYPIGMKDKADARQAMMDMAKTVANYRHSRAAELYKFSSGSKFTSPSVKFAWNNGVKVDRYKLTRLFDGWQ